MGEFDVNWWFLLIVFFIGYSGIILEYYIKVNKTAVALFFAVILWTIYIATSNIPLSADLVELRHHVSEIAQILFFLMGAMTLVELIDSHRGFKMITDRIQTRSKRKMILIVAVVAFLLSSVLDNLTTTILMVSLLRKLVPHRQDRFLLGCIVVVAANAGGAWTPIGDITTTMLWINGQLSTYAVMKSLFIPSVISLLVPLAYFAWQAKGRYAPAEASAHDLEVEPGAVTVFVVGVSGLVFVPVFKALTGLPPFMGVIISLALLWIITDLMHFKHTGREHLRVPHILTRVDTSGILFFLGILLCVAVLQTAGILNELANWLNATIAHQAIIATLIGIISAVIDNVPLVAATMGMYPLQNYPIDSSLWHMIAYAAGTGGSILIIGSSAGVALMGLEKVDFVSYLKKASLPILIGYLLGMGAYLLTN
ncbi:MAG TPA: sodium:proton antiporter NhaD [Rhabdochlamydiaceae bacterium]|nr:sodium:proton antiporter NhaD [Rhabdochlamydiaceae bacterium]